MNGSAYATMTRPSGRGGPGTRIGRRPGTAGKGRLFMAKKGDARTGAEPATNKRLKRKLEKLEARLATASDKRDRAQARLDALTIMADEVRATLAAGAPATDAADAAAVEKRAAAPSTPSPRRSTATKRA